MGLNSLMNMITLYGKKDGDYTIVSETEREQLYNAVYKEADNYAYEPEDLDDRKRMMFQVGDNWYAAGVHYKGGFVRVMNKEVNDSNVPYTFVWKDGGTHAKKLNMTVSEPFDWYHKTDEFVHLRKE